MLHGAPAQRAGARTCASFIARSCAASSATSGPNTFWYAYASSYLRARSARSPWRRPSERACAVSPNRA